MEINSPDQPINHPITPVQPVSNPVNNKKGSKVGGAKLFNQILSTFKFTDQNQTVISPSSSTVDLSIFNLLASQDTNIKWGTVTLEKSYPIRQNGKIIRVDVYSGWGTKVSTNINSLTNMGDHVKLEAMGWKDDSSDLVARGPYVQGWGYRKILNGKRDHTQ